MQILAYFKIHFWDCTHFKFNFVLFIFSAKLISSYTYMYKTDWMLSLKTCKLLFFLFAYNICDYKRALVFFLLLWTFFVSKRLHSLLFHLTTSFLYISVLRESSSEFFVVFFFFLFLSFRKYHSKC